MRIDILTLFPEMIEGIINSSISKRAIDSNLIEVHIHDFRDYSRKANKRVDDYSYGGGAGMIIEVQPIVDCLRSIPGYEKAYKVITTAQAKTYNQKKASELSKVDHLIIICGHYEGVDYRIMDYVDEGISIGDYILTGGEPAAIVIYDSVIRLLPDVLGNSESTVDESFSSNLLEYPQYTRPPVFEGKEVPSVLINGHHEKIRVYRRKESLRLTKKYRPDLLEKANLTEEDKKLLEDEDYLRDNKWKYWIIVWSTVYW